MSRRMLLVASVAALALGGCATIPKPIAGTYPNVSLDAARSGTAGSTQVRWGGEIIKTEPRQQQTCFFVLSEPLNSQARPQRSEDSPGRFMACKAGFYDPEVFAKGREITVTGALAGTVQHKIGAFDYTYPKVVADNVYLWPLPQPYVRDPYWNSGFYSPFWSPWNYGGWGYSPWMYSPRVIVVPRRVPMRPPTKK